MKEFALKHPWMTFFLIDAAITNAFRLVAILTGHGGDIASKPAEKPEEPETETEESES